MTFVRRVRAMGLLVVTATAAIHAQTAAQPPSQPPPPPPRGRVMAPPPKPGVCPMPILPALPAENDSTFFASSAVPHGTVEQATYKTKTGEEKRLHVYLPPDYQKNA